MRATEKTARRIAASSQRPPHGSRLVAGPGRGDAAGVHPHAPVPDGAHAVALRPRPSRPWPPARPRPGYRGRRTGGRLGDRRPAPRHHASRAASCACATTTPRAASGMRQIWHLGPDGPRAFHLAATVASEGSWATRPGFRSARSRWSPMATSSGPISTRCTGWPICAAPTRRPLCRDFKFPSGAQRVELAIRLRHATGELSVSGLELRALERGRGCAGYPGPAGRLGR